MAVSSSFKQQCPSCEALVPIKDGSFIGKKVDCPKCKYRFVVEDPVEQDKQSVAKGGKGGKNGSARQKADLVEVDDAVDEVEEVGSGGSARTAAKRAKVKKSTAPEAQDDEEGGDEDRPRKAKKKKQSGNNTLIVGLGLAAVGLVVLAAAAIFLLGGFGGGSKGGSQANNQTAKNQNTGALTPIAQSTGGGGDNENKSEKGNAVGEQKTPAKRKTPAADVAKNKGSLAGVEHTNFLPRSTEAVYHCYFKDLLESPVGMITFRAPGAFSDAEIKKRLGFSILDVDDILTAESYTEQWTFTVIHTTDPITDLRPLAQAMYLQKWSGNPTSHECFELQNNADWVMAFSKMALFVPAPMRNAQPTSAKPKPVLLHLRDHQTLIFANPEPMLAYLKANGRIEPYPENVGRLPSTQIAKAAEEKQQGGANDDPQGGAKKDEGPPGAVKDRNGNVTTMKASGTGGAAPVSAKNAKQASGTPSEDPSNKMAAPDPTKAFAYMTLRPALRDLLIRVETKGRDSDKLLFSASSYLRAAMSRSKNPDDFGRVTFRSRFIWDVVNLLDEKTDRIEHVAMAMMMRDVSVYLFQNLLTCSSDSETRQLGSDVMDSAAPQVVSFFKKVAGLDVEYKTAPKAQAPKGLAGGVQGGKGAPPSSADDAAGASGAGGGPPIPPPGAPTGRGGQGGNPAPAPVAEFDEQAKSSRILVVMADKAVKFRLDLVLPGQALEQATSLLSMMVLGLKAETDIAGGENLRWRLAEAGKLLGEKGRSDRGVPPETFPPGAFPRPLATKRTDREPPSRISWMAGLLPYLGHDTLYSRIDFNKSWRDTRNWMAARTLVPEFIDPSYPYYARYAVYPGMPLDCAATHYVGISGVGVDAAEAAAGDPAMVGKLGIFGYDRATPLKTIQEKGRGLANTVLMIRVPYDGNSGVTPWMAGGGSTVRSVPEKNSLEPFLSTDPDGQRGTYALMADGTVRYLKKGMSPEVFKAICTVDGPTPNNFFMDDEFPPLKEPKKAAAPAPLEKPLAPTPGSKSGGGTSAAAESVAKVGASATPDFERKANGEVFSKAGKFSIKFPAGEVKVQQAFDTAKLGAKATVFVLEKDQSSGYALAYFELPPSPKLATPDGLKSIYDQFRSMAPILFQGSRVASEEKVTIAGVEGREWAIEGLQNVKARLRVVIVSTRLYAFGFQGGDALIDSKEAEEFFSSFSATK
jgi:hypothetical protein